MSIKTVVIGGKVSDMFDGSLLDENGRIVESHDGYVPCIEAIGGGDYLELEIDNETGVIKNWKPITTFKVEE